MPNSFSAFKNAHHERYLFSRRIFIIGLLIGLLTLVLILRLGYLQVSQHDVYTTLARQNQLNLLPLEPNRGLIYDRKGVLLAENMPVFNLVITPNRVNNLQNTLAELQKIIAISDDDLQQFNRQLKMHRRFEAIPVRTRLTEEEVARFSVEQFHFPGVTIQADMIRHYPFGPAFAQVVGFVGRINAKELDNVDPTNYSVTNYIGKTGVEKFYETQLHGDVGSQQAETDASGQIIRVFSKTLPVPGDNLYLTIDSQLQLAAEKILGDQRGAIVAINPKTGEILALVSNPSFDPNLFVAGISQKDFHALQSDPDEPLYNRALSGKYAPGSTVKPFIGLEALNSNIVNNNYSIYDPGWFKLNNDTHIYHGFERRSHGTVNLLRAIAVSSDVYFYNIALKLGIERIAHALNTFGFGEKTNVDLPGEVSGVVPSPEWKEHIYKKGWYPGDTLNAGIGQGYTLVTPMQLVCGVAAIASQGQRWKPHVIQKTQSGDGTQTVITPTALTPIQMNKNTWETVLAGMHGVTTMDDGTATPYFKDAEYTVAGKTGTAQVFSLKGQKYSKTLTPKTLRDNSLFVAFAPFDNPTIAIAVVVQNSTTPAAKVARDLLDFYFGKNKTT